MTADAVADHFHRAHEAAYSFALPDAAIEITGLHFVGVLESPVIGIPSSDNSETSLSAAIISEQPVYQRQNAVSANCSVFRRDLLPPSVALYGPSLIREATCTTQVLDGQTAYCDHSGLLIIQETDLG